MLKTLSLHLVVALLAFSSMHLSAADDMQILKDAPPISASLYRADYLIRAVNHLRKLGREEALRALKNYAKQTEHQENEKIFLICRCLFKNPRGWKQPILGRPSPLIVSDNTRKFPLFPLAIKNGVPFLIVEGYELQGSPELVDGCMQLCGHLPLISEDMPETNLKEAAQRLVTSKEFKELYAKPDYAENMAKLVILQAEPMGTPETK